MAYLTNQRFTNPIHLKAFHKFGRLSSSVNTTINLPDVSRIHAIIEFQKHWFIRDISQNGIRINGQMIEPNRPQLLNVNDQILFSSAQTDPFVVESLEPPKDVLLPTQQEAYIEQDLKPIYLEHYHFLPNDTSPELVVFYDPAKQEWQCEHFENNLCSSLNDGEQIKFSEKTWQLFKSVEAEDTETMCLAKQPPRNLCYIFNISLDEELTELTIRDEQRSIDCQARSHHYLTALLARYKAEDLKNNVAEPMQGWRTIEQLTKDLGLAETHINIQIYRARKQLSELLEPEGVLVPNLIERKRGRIRLAIKDYQIIKGSKLEVDSRHLAA
ncbi:FHA domain-containing protein [Vibrio gigantis]|nr:FHA domain protein [Vibrio chagasii]CAH6972755.1 FHA domain protein [Vibrio chagasii]CAH6974884.1 FHA domain protein [Vibrio chagasii]CAH6981111.1 FHA domain protein [Vibrio chagasii]CAH6986542.1 FHA domain protein [Vibrio chagasii]